MRIFTETSDFWSWHFEISANFKEKKDSFTVDGVEDSKSQDLSKGNSDLVTWATRAEKTALWRLDTGTTISENVQTKI